MKKQIKAILFAGVLLLAGAVAGSITANAGTPEIKYSGTDGSVNWSIDENGHLLLTGEGDYEEADWISEEYRLEIKTATVKVKNMTSARAMFATCENLEHIDFSEFETKTITDMSYMFYECGSLSQIDLSRFNTENVTIMNFMFGDCYSLINLDVSSFNTAKVTDMLGMFNRCENLKSLDVSGFETKNVTSMTVIFSCCESLKELDLGMWDLSALKADNGMFGNMPELVKLVLPNSPVSITLPDWFYDEGNELTKVAPANKGKVTYILQSYAESYCTKNGHNYDAPMFIWNADYKKVKARFKCLYESCRYDKEVEIPAVITVKTIEPTSEKEGETIYTATVVFQGKTYTDTKSILIEKLPTQPQNPTDQEDPKEPTPQQPTPQAPTEQPAAKPVGTILKTSKASYRVTKAGKTPEVAYVKPKSKKVKTVTIPATVKKGGVTYKVTSVADNAMKNYKNLTKVTVGTNVKKIGKNAFYGCKKLGKIVIKSKKLKGVGKNAFKGIKKNATIDVPNSKKKTYKKLFTGKTGYKKTMNIK